MSSKQLVVNHCKVYPVKVHLQGSEKVDTIDVRDSRSLLHIEITSLIYPLSEDFQSIVWQTSVSTWYSCGGVQHLPLVTRCIPL